MGRLSLYWRMVVALSIIVAVSVTIVFLAVAMAGTIALLVFVFVNQYAEHLGESGRLPAVVTTIVETPLTSVVVLGTILFPVVYVRPVLGEISSFRKDLGADGDPARETHPAVDSVARRLAQQAGIPAPTVYVVEDDDPESYTFGTRSDGTIILSTKLVAVLSDDELEAVLAHELSHLLNRDSRMMGIALIPMLVADRLVLDRAPPIRERHAFTSIALGFLWLLLKAVVGVQKRCSMVGVATLSRGRELEADRAAATLTGQPSALASALTTLTDVHDKPAIDRRSWKRASQALNIVPPGRSMPGGFRSTATGRLFQTHPETETRVERLEAMVAEMETDG